MKRPVAAIFGTGRGLPQHVMTNHDFASIGIETSHEWIMERSGISERRLAKNGETTASMASEAARHAMAAANVHAGELDVIDGEAVVLYREPFAVERVLNVLRQACENRRVRE